jgi:hypothetical protein
MASVADERGKRVLVPRQQPRITQVLWHRAGAVDGEPADVSAFIVSEPRKIAARYL